ncbi:hypothetical protein BS47DRAFT_380320 [Hydnum rufescens UP504]|uniref:Uncharacterized protein n=1 Tax=Hydnum rufescens UP504 TaxID=1448309 RepID=A0A9P6DQN9_9AGAM|nr:hypothetical protein BS47DRAFT_380320 [Hydnum rufescens UP504]
MILSNSDASTSRDFPRSNSLSSSRTSISEGSTFQPFIKSSRSFFNMNFNICSASIRSGCMRVHLLVSVSELEENTCSQGTDVA